jgi:hypothetical protein
LKRATAGISPMLPQIGSGELVFLDASQRERTLPMAVEG